MDLSTLHLFFWSTENSNFTIFELPFADAAISAVLCSLFFLFTSTRCPRWLTKQALSLAEYGDDLVQRTAYLRSVECFSEQVFVYFSMSYGLSLLYRLGWEYWEYHKMIVSTGL